MNVLVKTIGCDLRIKGNINTSNEKRERESKGGQQEENGERSDRREASNWSFLERGFNRSSIRATPVRLRLTLLSLRLLQVDGTFGSLNSLYW